ncbi:hypothetical protein HN446_02190 [bacterium]|jgi:hypothetical protein|nr:hypothetical protein [bacterium]
MGQVKKKTIIILSILLSMQAATSHTLSHFWGNVVWCSTAATLMICVPLYNKKLRNNTVDNPSTIQKKELSPELKREIEKIIETLVFCFSGSLNLAQKITSLPTEEEKDETKKKIDLMRTTSLNVIGVFTQNNPVLLRETEAFFKALENEEFEYSNRIAMSIMICIGQLIANLENQGND